MDIQNHFFILLILLLNLMAMGVSAQVRDLDGESGMFRVIAEIPPVFVEKMKVKFAVSDLGMALEEHDEVITGVDGRAFILLSLLSGENEIYLAPQTKVNISQEVINTELTIFHIHLIHGKVRARIQITKGMEIRINTESAEIVSSEAEFIVENINGITSVGSVRGSAKLISLSTNRMVNILDKTMSLIDRSNSIALPIGMTKSFYIGVEQSDFEKSDDVIALIKEGKKAAAEKKKKMKEYQLKEQERRVAADSQIKNETIDSTNDINSLAEPIKKEISGN